MLPIPEPPDSPHRVPFDGAFELGDAPTAPPEESSRKRSKRRLDRAGDRLRKLQRKLVADGRFAVLVVLQGIDASGKDGAIRKVFRHVNPAACRVHAFGRPTREELGHDFLWRVTRRLPERGVIGVFNRSHYEDVVIARVHPALLEAQKTPRPDDLAELWEERFAAIRAFERHLAASGTVVLKFLLHLSPEEQRRRFLRRIERPEKHWKFESADARERRHWHAYQQAYQDALRETARPWAPWYAIPADDKPYARAEIADVTARAVDALDLRYPPAGEEERRTLDRLRIELEQPGALLDESP